MKKTGNIKSVFFLKIQSRQDRTTNLILSTCFCYKRKVAKKPWITWNTWLKFAQIGCPFFGINYEICIRWYWKHQKSYDQTFNCFNVGSGIKKQIRAESNSSASLNRQRHSYNDIPLVWASIYCELKLENTIYELGKVDDRIPVLQLTRSKSIETWYELWIEKDHFKPGSIIDWIAQETF